MTEQHWCTVDPMGTGNHSDDLIEVHHGAPTPALMCGYHATFWPELAREAAHVRAARGADQQRHS